MMTAAATSTTNSGMPRTVSRAASVNPSGRPDSGTWWGPAMR